jgi:hypothetical protein
MREMYDTNGNSQFVHFNEVQSKLKSGWSFTKPAVVKTGKMTVNMNRPKATMRITKAEAEVIKPNNEEDN